MWRGVIKRETASRRTRRLLTAKVRKGCTRDLACEIVFDLALLVLFRSPSVRVLFVVRAGGTGSYIGV